jgi:hypothetical protein
VGRQPARRRRSLAVRLCTQSVAPPRLGLVRLGLAGSFDLASPHRASRTGGKKRVKPPCPTLPKSPSPLLPLDSYERRSLAGCSFSSPLFLALAWGPGSLFSTLACLASSAPRRGVPISIISDLVVFFRDPCYSLTVCLRTNYLYSFFLDYKHILQR